MQLASTGICGTDDHAIKGLLSAIFPFIPGHEGAGIVESIGKGVTSVKPGKKWGHRTLLTNSLPKNNFAQRMNLKCINILFTLITEV